MWCGCEFPPQICLLVDCMRMCKYYTLHFRILLYFLLSIKSLLSFFYARQFNSCVSTPELGYRVVFSGLNVLQTVDDVLLVSS